MGGALVAYAACLLLVPGQEGGADRWVRAKHSLMLGELHGQGSVDAPPAAAPQEARDAPSHNPIFSPRVEAEGAMRVGKRLRNIGLGLLIPGLALTVYGAVASVLAFRRMTRDHDPYESISTREILGTSALFTTGYLSLGLGIPATIGGSVLIVIGRRRIEEAQGVLEDFAGVRHLKIVPIVSPGTSTYGAMLELRF